MAHSRRISDIFDAVGYSAFDLFDRPQNTYPPYDMFKQDDTTYVIKVVLNGGKKEDVEVFVSDAKLNVRYNAPTDRDEGINYLHKGISTKSFELKFNITKEHLIDDIKASVEDGILTVVASFKKQEPIKINVL